MSENAISRIFVIKHWRGEYAFPVAFWVVGVVTIIALNAVSVFFLDHLLAANFGKKIVLSGIVLHNIFLNIILCWLFVGIWRSSDNYLAKGGRRIWGKAAKLILVVCIVSALVQIYHDRYMYVDYVNEMTSNTGIKPYSIQLLNDGKELELTGDFELGMAMEVREVINKTPQVHVIRMNSYGGSMVESYRMAKLIKDFKLTTYTNATCASACAYAFTAGRERYIGINGKLGFHGILLLKGASSDDYQKRLNILSEMLRQNGLKEDFIKRALAIDSSNIWFPTTDELLKANVINSVLTKQ